MIKFDFDSYKGGVVHASAQKYVEAYKSAYRLAPTVPDHAKCFVTDHKKWHQDLDDSKLNFRVGTYKMGPTESQCLLKKIVNPPQEEPGKKAPEGSKVKFSSYSVLKHLRHRNIVTTENFYDAFGVPTLVLWVNGTLESWLKSGDNKTKFFGTSITRPSSWFRKLAGDLSSALEYLFEKEVYPDDGSLENLYVCLVGTKVCLKILICEVTKLSHPNAIEAKKKMLWEKARTTLLRIAKCQSGTVSPAIDMFCKYIGNKTSTLEGYPDIWTNNKKVCYLLTIVASDAVDVRKKLSNANIAWPKATSGDVNPLLRAVVNHEMKKNIPVEYDISDPYDYLRLCKNILKHWLSLSKKVDLLKSSCSDRDGFIQRMENWDRKIWFKLYEAIGWPEQS
ncbi:unnamed protein product [Urochloa decumbens]|uniref:Uncharacterized protein n=1 Tax=Urochloa decumbens TaxID=240449 RepID=A0ABC9A6X7_9POAL